MHCRCALKLFVVLCVILLGGIMVLTRLSSMYFIDQWNGKFFHVPNGITLANFGSSHGHMGFDYSGISGETCFNFALSGQLVDYDNALLSEYGAKIAKGAALIIPVSHFAVRWNITGVSRFESEYRRYYYGHIVSPRNMPKYSMVEDFLVNYWPYYSQGRWAVLQLVRSLIHFRLPPQPEWSMWDARKPMNDKYKENIGEYAKKRFLYCNTAKHGNAAVNGGYSAETVGIGPHPRQVEALGKIVRKAKALGAVPVLITTPFTDCYNQAVDAEFSRLFYQMIANVCRETGVKYHDYSHDPRFEHDYSLFYDQDHLCAAGAKKFTAIVYDEIVRPIRQKQAKQAEKVSAK